MYRVEKRLEISASHKLNLDYDSKCTNLHGHNWIIYITLQSTDLDDNGMIMDFTHIKQAIHEKLDHKNLNEIFHFNPTAENIARCICNELGRKCIMVKVQESEGNIATYIKPSQQWFAENLKEV